MNKKLTIALVWELGAGLGHVATFLPIAKEMKKRGCRPVLILRDISQANAVGLEKEGVEILQAPVWLPVRVTTNKSQLNFTDSLFHFGYLDKSALQGSGIEADSFGDSTGTIGGLLG